MVRELHSHHVEVQRFACEQSFASSVPVVELYEVPSIELGTHKLLLHRSFRLPRRVEGEPVVLVVEARDLALHPKVEILVRELGLKDLVDLLGVGDLLLDDLVLVLRDLLGDQRADDLPPVLFELVRRKVVLEEPLVRAPFVGRLLARNASLLRLPLRGGLENLRRKLSPVDKR